MFCSNCGKQAGANDMYCGKCGKPIAATNESLHQAAGTAFDTAAPGGATPLPQKSVTAQPVSGGGGAFMILLGIIIAGIIIAAVMNSQDGGGTSSGGFRSCVTSSMGKLPSCGDGPGGDGTSKTTQVNGKNIGVCRNVSVSGACIK